MLYNGITVSSWRTTIEAAGGSKQLEIFCGTWFGDHLEKELASPAAYRIVHIILYVFCSHVKLQNN